MTSRMSRRNVLALGAGAALAAPFVRTAQAQTRTVYVNSYGGVWETSWRKAFFDPFTAQTKIQVKTVPGVSFAKLKAQVQSRNFDWDVVNLGDVEYAQLATAYTVVMCGLVLVVFVQPPTRAWVGGDVLSGDRRPTQLATLLLIGFLLISPLSLAQRFLNTAPLRQLSDYALIALIVAIWAIVLRTLWRSRLFRGGLMMDATVAPEPE